YRQLAFGLVIALIALYYTLRNVSFSEVISSFKEMDYIYIFPAIVLIVLSYIFRAYRWQALLESSLKINVSGLYSPMMVGFMGNFLPARAAEILRPYLLSKKYNITFAAAFASIVVERLFDMIILLLIFIWVFWFEADAFSSNIKFSGFSVQEMAIKFGQICVLAVILIIVFIYLLLNHKKKMMKIVGWFLGFMSEKWADKTKYLLDEFTVGCEVVKKIGTLAKISVYSVLVWVANIFSVYPLYFAFDLQYKTISSLLILGVIVAILITILPTPGFLGSYNAGIVIALHEIMGESEIKSVSLGMVGWALFSGAILVGGLYFIFHEHMSIKDLSNVKRERDSSL
ncbi:MAG: flippase-like domain-containing protein, partial [Nitrospina sp.]|nr:flippase-like domain-containing protein [Nitrospina sp.]